MAASPDAPYAVVQTKDLVETHRLIDRERDAEVVLAPVRGGMVTRFRIGDDDILFLDQATLRDHTQNVRGGIPILFPFAGRLADDVFVWENERMPMPQHGFARKMPWRVSATSSEGAATATMLLEHSEATLALWPFRFRLLFRYELKDGALHIHQRYENVGPRPMPIHPGLHPYFRVEDYRKRHARVPTRATRAVDTRLNVERDVPATIDLGSGEVHMQLLDHNESQVRLERPQGDAIRLAVRGGERVVTIWTLPGRDFVSVQPWTARADAVNRGEARIVAPGDAHVTELVISRGS